MSRGGQDYRRIGLELFLSGSAIEREVSGGTELRRIFVVAKNRGGSLAEPVILTRVSAGRTNASTGENARRRPSAGWQKKKTAGSQMMFRATVGLVFVAAEERNDEKE